MINNQLALAIKNYADKEGSGYNNWYCGIASNIDQRLFSDHNAQRPWWIHNSAGNEADARDTEQYLLDSGFDGGSGGGDHTTVYVYAYKKIPGITIEG